MVKVRLVVPICDWPGCENEAEEWHLTPPGRPRCPIDLCEEHAAPLMTAYENAPKGNGGGHQVKTMEQIEREKAAAKRAAARRAKKKD